MDFLNAEPLPESLPLFSLSLFIFINSSQKVLYTFHIYKYATMPEEREGEETVLENHHLERPNTVPAANQPKKQQDSLQTASPRMH